MNAHQLFIEKFKEAGGEIFKSLEEVIEEFKGSSFAVEPRLKRRLQKFDVQLAPPEEAEVSITRANVACAETGSLIFAFKKGANHKLTSLPKIHVALINKKDIYPTLEEALSKVEGSYISVITGPSKTGDIELIHVFGVHGPERLICVLEGR